MKKSLTILALAFGVTGAYAQDLTSKKGEQILPEAKDWAIGIDASPFLNYMGNFFGKSANNSAPGFNFLNSDQIITGKYFVEAQTAYRASLRIGFGGQTQRSQVADRSYVPTGTTNNYPNLDPVKENSWKHSRTNIALAAGIEKRKGKTRLQGYYGAEVGFGISSSKETFDYGNGLAVGTGTGSPTVGVENADNFSQVSNVVDLSGVVPGIANNDLGRMTERKNGTTFSFGVRAFIGVEYFVLPKISLGGEFGWGIVGQFTGKTSTTYESIGNNGAPGAANVVGTTTIESPKSGAFALDTDNNNSLFGPAATLRLNFHF